MSTGILKGLSRQRKRLIALFIVWIVISGLLVNQLSTFSIEKVYDALSQSNVLWLFIAVVSHYLVFFIWTVQWRVFMDKSRRLSWKSMFGVATVFSAATNVIPFNGGHALGVWHLSQRKGVGMPSALAVLTQDQVARGVAKLFFIGLLLVVYTRPVWLSVHSFIVLSASLIIGLLLIWLGARLIGKVSIKPQGAPLIAWGIDFIQQWKANLGAFQSRRSLLIGLSLGILLKFFELLPLYFVSQALSLELTWVGLLLIFVALNLATAISVSPGNFGVYEGAAIIALEHLGVPPEKAFVTALLFHLCWLIPMAGSGIIVMAAKLWTSPQKLRTAE